MILGLTATRKGITKDQCETFLVLLRYEIQKIHLAIHGGAVGGDENLDTLIWRMLGLRPWWKPPETQERGVVIEVYPSNEQRAKYFRELDSRRRHIHPVMEPLKRNRIIVDRSDIMVACPAEADEQPRGGTWATIRYARKLRRPLLLIGPTGDVQRYNTDRIFSLPA